MLVLLRYSNIRDQYKEVIIEMEVKEDYFEKRIDPFEKNEITYLSDEGFKKAVEIAKKNLDNEKKTYKNFSSSEIIHEQ